MNNKQIMYDCDKGYILNEKGPVGATCGKNHEILKETTKIIKIYYLLNLVGGIWRPTELPQCDPGLHPRLRWNRRKRSAEIEQKQKLLRNFSRFKREMSEILRKNVVIDDPFPLRQIRAKRSLLHHRGVQRKIHRRTIPNRNSNHKWHLVAPAIMRFKRNVARKRYPEIDYEFVRPHRNDFQQRSRFEEAQRRAYHKYYEKIRRKHRDYINNLLRASNSQRVIDDDDEPLIFDNKDNTYHDEDDYKTPAQDPFDEINAYASMPIPLPNINENRNVYEKSDDGIVNNTFVGRGRSNSLQNENGQLNNRNYLPHNPANFEHRQHEKNATDILNLLRSQIVRRRKRILYGTKNHEYAASDNGVSFHRVKRAPRAPKKSEDAMVEEDGNGSDTEGSKKSKSKEPCEVSNKKRFYTILY